MTTPNHIAGGIVFTGLFCSLWNVNIFANPLSISTVILCSILPDIDHRKSIIGRVFFPISKYLQKHYGHRTITHSLLALVIISVVSYSIQRIFNLEMHLFLIVFFAYLSHIILDMITLQGVAFLSPFYKNPCVIPANPDLRFRTGNTKQEGMIFFVLAFSSFFMQPLFANGFWSSYNKSFDSIEHVFREFNKNKNAIKVHYRYSKFNNIKEDTAWVIKANKSRLIVLDNTYHSIIKSPEYKIDKLKIINTDKFLKANKININQISVDSLNSIVDKKYVNKLYLISTAKIILETSDVIKNSNAFELEEITNVRFSEVTREQKEIDISAELKHNDRQNQIKDRIAQLRTDIAAERKKENLSRRELQELKAEKINLLAELNNTSDNYNIQEIKSRLIALESLIKNYSIYKSNQINKYQSLLNQNLRQVANYIPAEKTILDPITVSGQITILEIQ